MYVLYCTFPASIGLPAVHASLCPRPRHAVGPRDGNGLYHVLQGTQGTPTPHLHAICCSRPSPSPLGFHAEPPAGRKEQGGEDLCGVQECQGIIHRGTGGSCSRPCAYGSGELRCRHIALLPCDRPPWPESGLPYPTSPSAHLFGIYKHVRVVFPTLVPPIFSHPPQGKLTEPLLLPVFKLSYGEPRF